MAACSRASSGWAAIDFSRAVDAPIVTSMPIGEGTRGADGVWRPDQARRWLAFTKAHGGTIAAAEYFNEPTLASMGGAPKGYDAAAFGRDFRVFDAFMRKEYPGTKLLAPGSVGEANADWAVATGGYGNMKVLPAADLAASTGDADAFSYHHYGAVSQRCAAMGHQTSADQALSEDWLGRTDQTLAYYRAVRDKAMPGKPFWNTETADAACGGNPWAGTFLDTLPLPRPARPARSSGGERRHPQHAGRQRLRPAGRKHLRAQAQLSGARCSGAG